MLSKPVVAVDDDHPLLFGDPGRQQLVDPVDHGRARLAVQRRLGELAVPPFELAGDVAVPAGEVAQADGVDVHGMEPGQGVDERRSGSGPRRLGQQRGGPLVADDVPLDEGHDVERRTVHRFVGAQPQGPRHRHPGVAQGADHRVLALHVVGGGQHVADRWSPEGIGTAAGVGDPVGQVGPPTGDQFEGERWLGAGDGRPPSTP